MTDALLTSPDQEEALSASMRKPLRLAPVMSRPSVSWIEMGSIYESWPVARCALHSICS